MRIIVFLSIIIITTLNVGAQNNSLELSDIKTNKDSLNELKQDTTIKIFPEFPGGQIALFNFIMENIVFPNSAKDETINGKVITQFFVNTDGSISDISIIKSLQPDCDKEFIRVIKLMPNWIPGQENGQIKKMKYILPLSFRTA